MGETEGEISEVAAGGFGAGAATYEQGRPSYPADLVAHVVDHLAIGPGRSVLDLAAGTGKLTRLLTPTGADVRAVEPVAAMREQLELACPGIEVLDGTAEQIPLADGAVDVVTVAQAFHWFDAPRALAEIARVLRPGGGGGLAIAFNERDARVPWVAELSRIIRWDERERWRVPYTVEVDWAAVLGEHGPAFEPAERYDTTYLQPMDPDTLVARVLSTSYLAVLPEADQRELEAAVRELVAPLGPTFELPYVSVAHVARRR
ncbi:MAG: methyltransferase domain-containing protein [Acidimicrobiales bacterium]|nr:methyltransferase domain-containing protein [Acidimicrobiales bacterium]